MTNLLNDWQDSYQGLTQDQIKQLLLTKLQELPPEELAELQRQTDFESFERAKNDFVYFCRHYVYTQDEHDEIDPIKKLPDKEYLMGLAHVFQTENKVLVEKSRQMMVTWLACAYALWEGFKDGKRIFIQSKKEKDANALLDRVKLIYANLPPGFKALYPTDPPAYCKMSWGKRNTIIEAIPQGADVLRQYTASLIISDEMAFQDKSEEAYSSARPTLIGGGKFIGISSPNFKEFFYRLLRDEF